MIGKSLSLTQLCVCVCGEKTYRLWRVSLAERTIRCSRRIELQSYMHFHGSKPHWTQWILFLIRLGLIFDLIIFEHGFSVKVVFLGDGKYFVPLYLPALWRNIESYGRCSSCRSLSVPCHSFTGRGDIVMGRSCSRIALKCLGDTWYTVITCMKEP